MEITKYILSKLQKQHNDIIKQSRSNSPGLLWGEFVSRIVQDLGNTGAAYKLFPEMGMQTFYRMTNKAFPNLTLNGGNETWYHYLLSLIEYKNCGKCGLVQPYDAYHKDSTRNSGIASLCKTCKSEKQIGQYDKYRSSHEASQLKHKDAIKARNAEYRTERCHRNVPWTESTKIREFYAECPEGYHVDHIIPLKAVLVSGLHVISNLQYLSAKDNMQKGNRVDLETLNARVEK